MAKRAVILSCVLLGCSPAARSPGRDGTASGGGQEHGPLSEDEIVPIAGGQTGDFGSGSQEVCVLEESSEIARDDALALGLSVEPQLALLSRAYEGSLHWGAGRCEVGAPADEEPTIALHVEPDSLRYFHNRYRSASGFDCPDTVTYEAIVNLESSDKLLRGRFYARFGGRDSELCVDAVPDLRNFRGPFRFTVDTDRPHWSVMEVNFCIGDEGASGRLNTLVRYTDVGPEQDFAARFEEESGGHWHVRPVSERPEPNGPELPLSCSSPAVPDVRGANTRTLSEYKGSKPPPTASLAVRGDAVEPAEWVAITVLIDGNVEIEKELAPGTKLELGDFPRDTHLEFKVRNVHGAGQVRAHILTDGCFRATARCNEPDCTATAEHTVSFWRCVN